jgi:hypothetical protein
MLVQNRFCDISDTHGYGAVSEAQSQVILYEAEVNTVSKLDSLKACKLMKIVSYPFSRLLGFTFHESFL